jgi:hypothetical protein
MAWLSVDKDGTEHLFIYKPKRGCGSDEWFATINPISPNINLIPNSIKYLIGRKLKWEDEPVEI